MVPLERYGLIGDSRTAALCSAYGRIDWWCVPRFDSPPLVGGLVGGAGQFAVAPVGAGAGRQRYLPDTAVVETAWPGAVLTDALVPEVRGRLLPQSLLVRSLRVADRPVRVSVRLDPAYGGRAPVCRRHGDAVVMTWGGLAVAVTSSYGLVAPGREQVVEVTPDRPLHVVVSVADKQPAFLVPPEQAPALVAETVAFWRRWCADVRDLGEWRDAVVRSLVTLRLLTWAPSGAPVAAPTTSLPSPDGPERLWDYRYAWPRDASVGIAAFLGAGRPQEARAFLYWLLHASRLSRPSLPPLLAVDGCPAPHERWTGPFRTGNDARSQRQHDVYGWVLDAAALLETSGHRMYGETWRVLAGFADHVAGSWRLPDEGVWEVRDARRHYVHSKLMCWLTLDRALWLARRRRVRPARLRRWSTARDAIAADVHARGVDERRSCYVRSYGARDLDAALLLAPSVGLDPPGSPLLAGTIRAVRTELGAGGPLLYRYPPGTDGLPGREGAFLPCSFWLVEALARTGQREEAASVLADLLDRATPLGLYAEQVDPADGRHGGNFPQALTHAALVRAVCCLVSPDAGTDPARCRTPRVRAASPPASPARS